MSKSLGAPSAGKPSINPYLETKIKTAGSLELTAIMYDVLVSSLERALRAIEEGQIEERVRAMNRAISALVELRCSLDFERGGSLAKDLDRLYAYGLSRVTAAAIPGDATELRSLETIYAPLRDAWREAADSHVEAQAPAEETRRDDAVTLAPALLGAAL